ncbi:relaxase/mobilization nuclease domain-containing protein [Pseudomonas gregormendelii]|uniref:Relaxase/mobilization nuclease domain-containing protein n=1 Tax=Pseudomonas gregormendelii TaxID=1628277 RepID=A0ABS3AMZ7_9PSED|nr:relaxase/mobilization nuclease domain-containing protein [Pseudomonas gregormendelii]MBN3968297.1 relaxase/mobilization nuclease domain-containing protein [Pseudomonas gregormendelii]
MKKSILIDSNRLQTGTTQEFIEFLAKKIDKSCKGKQRNTSFHEMVSFDPSDKITPEQALAIAKELYSDTHGLNREHAFAVHTDTKQIHVHFIWAPRDFNNKIYNQVDDYLIIEQKLTELEKKHGLLQVTNRKSLNPDLETKPQESRNEKALEVRGIKSHKKQFKSEIEKAFIGVTTTTAFLANLHKQGFDIIPNGQNAYSLEKEGQVFKASELGIQHSKLKNKLQEQHQFSELMEHYSKKSRRYNEELNLSTNEDIEFLKKNKYKTVLEKKFTHQESGNNVEHFFKNSTSQKAFEYHKDPSKVTFQDLSRDSVKAGLQRLTTDMKKPGPLYVHGPDYAKKKMWMEFKMMNLEDKGFTLAGYKPTQQDLNELEQRKADYELQAQKWKAKKAIEEPKPVETVIIPPVTPTPVQNAPEKPPEPIKQVEQEQVGPASDDLIDDLMKEFEPITQDTSTHVHQKELIAAHVKNVESDFHIFIDELVNKHDNYKEIEILKYVRDVLEQNGNVIADAVIYFDITEKIDQLDDDEREICSAYVQKLIDDDGSGAPIDGELKQTNKRKFKLKM